jgi:hypothetical protein
MLKILLKEMTLNQKYILMTHKFIKIFYKIKLQKI